MAASFNIETMLAKALFDFNAGLFDEAAENCQNLLRLDPSNPAASQLLALVALQGGDLQAASEHICTSLASRPEHIASLLVAGRIARAANDQIGRASCRERV